MDVWASVMLFHLIISSMAKIDQITQIRLMVGRTQGGICVQKPASPNFFPKSRAICDVPFPVKGPAFGCISGIAILLGILEYATGTSGSISASPVLVNSLERGAASAIA
jgi:hypothetical protein